MNNTHEVDTIRFIAEIGSSHQGDIHHAMSLIDEAVYAGATDIKFQWIYADEIVSPHAGTILLPNGMTDIYQSFKTVEQDDTFYKRIQEYTLAKGVRFFCSVFGTHSLAHYMKLHPEIIKIASPEVNHVLLLEDISTVWKSMKEASTHLEVFLSDGMALQEDIIRAMTLLSPLPVTIFHCVTQYPASPAHYQLSRLPYYREHVTKNIGISDHTSHPYFLPVISRLCGASYIEKHFTLTKHTKGLDDSFALTPHEFATMVEATHLSSQYMAHTPSSDATVSLPSVEMLKDSIRSIAAHSTFSAHTIEPLIDHIPLMRAQCSFDKKSIPGFHTTRRSIFSARELSKGEILDMHNTQLLRSEQNITPGIPAELFHHVKGKSLTTDVDVCCPITPNILYEDLQT